jgi:tetratricopeptide (TPR) repeat protein
MPLQTEKDLSDKNRGLWLKALAAFEVRNFGYTISLVQAVLKEAPGFLDARRVLRRAEVANTKGKKNFLSGLSSASLKGSSMVKKDPLQAMELAEKNLESDPLNTQINHLLKDAAKAAGFPEIAAFALETIIESNPKDTKVMHELGHLYLQMGDSEKAVKVFIRITEINPADLEALKMSKDASAVATMKTGGWETAKDYRDLIKDKDQAASLEQQNRVVRSLEMIDRQIGEVYAQWEQNQSGVDLSRKLARLWEDRFDMEQDDSSLEGTIYYYAHINQLTAASDPGVVRKLSDFSLRQLDRRIRALEDWFASGGDQHPEAPQYQDELQALKIQRAEMLISEARKRVERNPTDLQLRFELGEALVVAGEYTEAIAELQRARQNPNVRLRAMNLLGQCYTEKSMLDLAVKQFKDAASEMIAMDVTKKEIVYKLGLVYEKMDRREDSLSCMKEIYEVDYGYQDVAKRVESSY